MIKAGRYTASLEGDFVVFLIGMRINKPWLAHRWMPVMAAMPRVLRELRARPELGLLHADLWAGRTVIVVQYWRSVDQLLAYASSGDAEHLPAWRAFNRAVKDDSVGIWHETYAVKAGGHESIYVNMPPFGLGVAGTLADATGAKARAAGRLARQADA